MNHLKLGIFDSGVGGFTVLKSVLSRHGELSGIYLADTARLPYGKKGFLEIREIAAEIVLWLKEQNITAMIVACNTTNSLAMDLVRQISGVPVFGLIDSVNDSIREFETRIGVLATPSTISSGAYKTIIESNNSRRIVFEQGCPSLVPLIETGQLSSKELIESARKYIEPLLDQNVQAIVLGCSHYPLIKSVFQKLLPDNVRLIDPANSLAKKLDSYLVSKDIPNQYMPTFSNIQFCVTSDTNGFMTRADHWLGICPDVELVSLKSIPVPYKIL